MDRPTCPYCRVEDDLTGSDRSPISAPPCLTGGMATESGRRVWSRILWVVCGAFTIYAVMVALVPNGDCGSPLFHPAAEEAGWVCSLGWGPGVWFSGFSALVAVVAGIAARRLGRPQAPESN